MKNYMLKQKEFLGINIKQIIYDFKEQQTNTPTHFNKIIIHHTGKIKTIQEIIDKHITKNHWAAIGFHFMISKKGTIYYSRDLKYAGAHTKGYNKNGMGIALFGNFDEINPTEKQLISLNKLILRLENEFKIKIILSHNQAIYKQIKNKFWKLNLPDINPLEINTKQSYDTFIREVNNKILEKDASEDTVSLVKRFQTCPGFNMYKIVKKLQNNM